MVARIYKPAKTAMQSGMAKTGRWLLVHEPEVVPTVEPLMGYTSSADMKRQVKLSFDTKEDAIAYCERNGIAYQLYEPHQRTEKKMAYSDNFRFNRVQAWTH